MRAYMCLSDPEHSAMAERALKRLGCTDIACNTEDVGSGVFHYAVVQVFDETVEHVRYNMDESHPRMRQLAAFIAAHPECYVLVVTHEPCENDGRTAHQIGADWWIMDAHLSLIDGALDHARTAHHQLKGVPSWAHEVA